MMDFLFLSPKILEGFEKVDKLSICEIRIRTGFPIICQSKQKIFYLCRDGLSILETDSIIAEKEDIDYIINSVTENSIYAYNDKLKNGYLTTNDGVRIGIAGECVFNSDSIITIKNISSLNIRIPNEIKGCSDKLFSLVFNKQIYNTLIISPPGFGKTTLLKDLCVNLDKYYKKNILIIDERGEFESISGKMIDKISFSNKHYAFHYAVRSMAPEIVITDELMTKLDWQCAYDAVNSGVNIIASCHGESIDNIKSKEYFQSGIFERYVVLDNGNLPGIIKRIYNKDFLVI